MSNKNLFIARYPINIYITIIVTLGCVMLAIPASIIKVLFYSFLTFFFSYIFLSRYACKIIITDSLLQINYFFPWENNIDLDLDDVVLVDYAKGFYDLYSDKTLGGLYVFPKYCYDQLVLTTKNGEVKFVNVNVRAFQFDKLFKKLEQFCYLSANLSTK